MNGLDYLAAVFLIVCAGLIFIGGVTASRWCWAQLYRYNVRRDSAHSRVQLEKWVHAMNGRHCNLHVDYDGLDTLTIRCKRGTVTLTKDYRAIDEIGGWRDYLALSISDCRDTALKTHDLVVLLRGET